MEEKSQGSARNECDQEKSPAGVPIPDMTGGSRVFHAIVKIPLSIPALSNGLVSREMSLCFVIYTAVQM
jgi:hypothetical protein